jgi:hypothetical protein
MPTWACPRNLADPATEPGRVPGFVVCCTKYIFKLKFNSPATVAGANLESENFMSCFVVSDFHVSALVAWAVDKGVPLDDSPDAVALALAAANRAAFSERYDGRHEALPFGGFDRSAALGLQPVEIIKACDCLAYQCSDWSAWDLSDASEDLALIRDVAVQLVLGPWSIAYGPAEAEGRELPGYAEAAWCLDPADPADLAADRLAAALAGMTAPELAAIRAALAATEGAA